MGALKRVGLTLMVMTASVGADEVHLRNGGVVRGVLVEQTDHAVVVETGPGRVSLPLDRVARIERTESALATFQERAAGVASGDVEGLARLARYASDHDLATHARETWRRVLALDPGHPEANAALGRAYLDGEWMDEQDAYRAQGYVRYRDRWVTPVEHDTLAREEAARERAASDRQAAEVRLREAEARAREAEARAREAEALADQAENPVDGIPYWWVLSGGGSPWYPGRYPPGPPTTLPERPHPRPPRTGPGATVQGEPAPPGSSGTIDGRTAGTSGRRH